MECKEDIGTTFKFTILTVKGHVAVKQYAHLNTIVNEGKKVLIVDDNDTNLSILKNQLELWKLVPVSASSGRQALQLLEQGDNFQLAIVGMQMPVMDGIDLAEFMKAKHPGIPIILLSSIGDEPRSKHPHLFNAVLTKPVKQGHLFTVVNEELLRATNIVYTSPVEPLKTATLPEDFALLYPLEILLTEDNLVNQKFALKVLSKLGYQAQLANTGREAVEKLTQQEYDLVLMDIQMPEMDGLEATRFIRENHRYQPVIVAMTGNALPSDKEECINAGMDFYMSKPFKLEVLVELLKIISLNLTAKKSSVV